MDPSSLVAWAWPWEWSWDSLWQTLQQIVLALADWGADFIVWLFDYVPDPPNVNWSGWTYYLAWANGFVPFETIKYAFGWYISWMILWSVFRIVWKSIWSG